MQKMQVFARTETAKLVWCVLGVVGTLMLYGIMQERIMKVPYGPEKEYFQHSLFIVLFNRLLTCAIAVGLLLVQGKSMASGAPIYKYAGVSISNVVATTCQYEALKYVSFPIQTLAKSGKMIPVMVWGTAIMQKKYGIKDYFVATLVTIGCAIFVLTGESSSVKSKKVVDSSAWGIGLMLGYLSFDGFTSTFQDKLFKGYKMETYNQILYVTLCSSVISLVGLLTKGDLMLAISFIMRYPECLFNIALLSMAATTSQFFISYTIRTFGALVFATIMTTRQLLSIILSCTLYGPMLTLGQLFGTLCVFGSLYFKVYTSQSQHQDEMVAAAQMKDTEPLLQSPGRISSQPLKEEQEKLIATNGMGMGPKKVSGLI